jgi:hypothetical protein
LNQVKSIKILARSGLNLRTPIQCNNCCNITERKFCKIWAFPETKWNETIGCPDYQSIENEKPDITIRHQ